MSQSKTYDVIIIGSGAGGGTVAQSLAETGKSILILERGEHLPREVENWDPKTVFIERKYRTNEKWVNKAGSQFVPNCHYWVGGNTIFYGAVLMRMRESDFEVVQHEDGVSPAWPISYGDLAPYYDQAEQIWRVRGNRGEDPAEPPTSGPYAHPGIRHDDEVARLMAHLRDDQGWKPFTLPLGVQRDDDDPVHSACIRCETCGGFPCLVKAKSDARTIAIEPLSKHPNVTLLTGRLVNRLETGTDGRTVTGVVCEGPDGQEVYSAGIVVLAAGAANTAAVLQRSATPRHPNGLANGSDQVGRNYMFHTMTAVISASSHKAKTRFPKTLGINDFYRGDPDGSYDFPMGHIQSLEYMEGPMLEGQLDTEFPLADKLIPKFIADSLARRMLSFLVLSEDLPQPDNRIRWLNGQIHLDYTHNNLSGHKRLVKKFDRALDGFCDGKRVILDHHFQVQQLLPIYGTAHQCGTARMGDDPTSSVVNADCRAHEVDNLYIVDTSVFCSSAAVNPTLTLVAIALRAGEHLRQRLSA
ncbi:GMC family oxidoreductase [uncultured Maricaulis sp.]|uniref:GMC family oxidoreductase n=1 Tax=uncultured Maricaulis sp. TaxID=174710 RepID=UPI0030DA6488|tara:strand:+ start:1086 stop:2666 length:1581 start_codon:yes stop_codon:yes gene_type:complete